MEPTITGGGGLGPHRVNWRMGVWGPIRVLAMGVWGPIEAWRWGSGAPPSQLADGGLGPHPSRNNPIVL